MKLLQATLRRDWLVYGRRFVDLALVVLLGITVFPGDQAGGFGVVGTIVAAALGARIGGDENLGNSLEFLWTRPVERGAWFQMRFGLGLAALGAVFAVVLVADVVDLHLQFASLFVDVLDSDPRVALDPQGYARSAGFVLLVYSLAFSLAGHERRVERVLDARGTAVTFALLAALAATLLGHVAAQLGVGSNTHDWGSWKFTGVVLAVFCTVMLSVATGVVLVARRRFVLGEISSNGTKPSGGQMSAWILVLIIGALAMLFLFWGVRAETPR